MMEPGNEIAPAGASNQDCPNALQTNGQLLNSCRYDLHFARRIDVNGKSPFADSFVDWRGEGKGGGKEGGWLGLGRLHLVLCFLYPPL